MMASWDMVASAACVSLTVAIAASCTSCAPTKPTLQSGPDTEVTYDGLYRLDHTTMDAAWVKPDLDLSRYTGLMIAGAGMSFKPVDDQGQRWWPSVTAKEDFPISEEDRKRLQTEMRRAFEEELAKLQRYELVDNAGPHVLMVEGTLIDVVSRVPPVDECVGQCDVYLTEIGDATLVLELRDSVTNEVLARGVDRRAPQSFHWPVEANSVTIWSQVRQLAQSWARLVRQRLEQLDSADDLAGG